MAGRGRIAEKFSELRARGEAALIPFIFAGNPDMERSARLVVELEARGADLIELGVPFSDPLADGPGIQPGSWRAVQAGFAALRAFDQFTNAAAA